MMRNEEPRVYPGPSEEPAPPRSASDCLRILVVDGQAVARRGLVLMLEEEGYRICGEAADGCAALELAREHTPDLVIVDPRVDGDNGLRLVVGLRDAAPEAQVLVFSTFEETLYAERALRAGASGYLMKAATKQQLLEAVREVRAGNLHVSRQVRSGLLRRLTRGGEYAGEHPLAVLTDREIEVFRLLGEGRSTREVADTLGLSAKTIETHRAKIMRKLGLENAAQLLHRAIAWVQFGDPDPGDRRA